LAEHPAVNRRVVGSSPTRGAFAVSIGTYPGDARAGVCAPDGRVGEVIGFYRAEEDAALVRRDSGDTRKYVRGESPADPVTGGFARL
jgi:hypothetical protein